MKLCLVFVVVFAVSATLSARVPGPRPNGKCNSLTDDYAEVLRLSNLFYEAQRSGKLPADNRVPWRGDSAVNDGSDVGVDLEGGYYDAGDDVKFGFPAAQAMTTLAWGGVAYKAGYQSAGEWENLLAAVKWEQTTSSSVTLLTPNFMDRLVMVMLIMVGGEDRKT